MDPITIIVTALALGAAAGLKDTAEQAVKDAYSGLKALIQGKYAQVDIDPIESKPESAARRAVVQEDLQESGAATDQELLDQANALIDIIERADTDAPQIVGVRLQRIESGAAIHIEDVRSAGSGVIAQDVKAQGDITIKGVNAGQTNDPNAPRP